MLEINRLLRINREDRSVDAQETSRKLVRGLAHEVKNPLVDRMLGPIQQPRIAPINVHKVLARVGQLIKAEYGDRISLRRDYDPSLPDVAADESLLVQAILNIVRNAAQALADTEEPTITLQTRVVRQFTIGTARHRLVAQIDIIDNGPGIPAELYDRIFYPMISGRPEGTGLGLAIAQQIMSQHQGALECESRPGQTRFSVYLPVEAAAGPPPAEEESVRPADGSPAEPSILEQS